MKKYFKKMIIVLTVSLILTQNFSMVMAAEMDVRPFTNQVKASLKGTSVQLATSDFSNAPMGVTSETDTFTETQEQLNTEKETIKDETIVENTEVSSNEGTETENEMTIETEDFESEASEKANEYESTENQIFETGTLETEIIETEIIETETSETETLESYDKGLMDVSDSVTWDISKSIKATYYPEKKLLEFTAFLGSGITRTSMPSYTKDNRPPWESVKDEIERIVIGEGISNVGSYAFYKMSNLKSIDFGAVYRLGSYSISYNDSLTSITISNNGNKYGDNGFIDDYGISYNNNLQEVTILLSGCKIDKGGLANNRNLKKVDLPEVIELGAYVLQSADNLEYLRLGKVKYCDSYAFNLFYPQNLKEVDFGISTNIVFMYDTKIYKNTEILTWNIESVYVPIIVNYFSNLKTFNGPNIQELRSGSKEQSSFPIDVEWNVPNDVGLGNYLFSNNTDIDIHKFPDKLTLTGSNVFSGVTLNPEVNLDNYKVKNKAALTGALGIKTIRYTGEEPLNIDILNPSIQSIYWLGNIDPSMTKEQILSTAIFYCPQNSPAEAWCKNVGQAYKILSEDEADEIVNGTAPVLVSDSLLFDADTPTDINLKVSLGKKPAGASGISKLMLGYGILQSSDWNFNGTDTITIRKELIQTLINGSYEIGVQFDNGTYRSGVTLKVVNSSAINDTENNMNPSLVQDTKLFDAASKNDLTFKVNLGKGDLAATGISRVMIADMLLGSSSYVFNGIDTITVKASEFENLKNGKYDISVEFDNGVYKTGAVVKVINSVVNEDTTPPEALSTIMYEFYKDYPDIITIPVKLNSARKIIGLRIGTNEVDQSNYELQDGALCIKIDYLKTLDVGKYRVLPTFDDVNNTTISNLMLNIFDKVADRGAPYLLQTRFIFKGEDIVMKYDAGYGDLLATNVLALVLDNELVLPDGNRKPFQNSNVSKIQEKGVLFPMLRSARAFEVTGDKIILKADYLMTMNLSAGEHLIGAIFDNTEKTTDIKKVIITVEEPDEPVKPDESVKPDEPVNPDESVKPDEPVKPDKPVNPDESVKPDEPVNPDEPVKPDEHVNEIEPNSKRIIFDNINEYIETAPELEIGSSVKSEKEKQSAVDRKENAAIKKKDKIASGRLIINDEQAMVNDKEVQDIYINYNCNCLSWAKILTCILIFVVMNTISKVFVFSLLYKKGQKKEF